MDARGARACLNSHRWDVKSPKELGEKLREKGAARKEALESGGTVQLVRELSERLVRPLQQRVLIDIRIRVAVVDV